MLPPIDALRIQLAHRHLDAQALLASCVGNIEADAGEGRRVFPHGISPAAATQAMTSDALRRYGIAGPLSGIPISVKDLFDVQGRSPGREGTSCRSSRRPAMPWQLAGCALLARCSWGEPT
jgi:Asp-tRNA(Asn)/Glu-tRNA(Gln) amidotransferase A subunit family amidase